ncbi:MAG: phosphoribosyltransferase [Actinobacteria bacterium]|nr:phosphoribosyltransferase [Actinomycetota bacterium]
MRLYTDREEAGRELAAALRDLELDDPLILGLPRGGVPVAREVADELDAPLDVLVVRKIGAPGHAEYGIGAIGEEDVEVLDDDAMRALRLGRADLEATIARERTELQRRVRLYRGDRAPTSLRDRTVVIVDDGLATGNTARAAVAVVRQRGAGRVVVAVPVGAPQSVDDLRRLSDEVVCPHAPRSFRAVGSWYGDFHQVTDEEVQSHLAA